MRNFAVFDMAARFDHFKPSHVLKRFRGAGDRILDGLLHTDEITRILMHYIGLMQKTALPE